MSLNDMIWQYHPDKECWVLGVPARGLVRTAWAEVGTYMDGGWWSREYDLESGVHWMTSAATFAEAADHAEMRVSDCLQNRAAGRRET